MRVPVDEHVARPVRGRAFGVEQVAVRHKGAMPAIQRKQRVIGHNGKLQHHLVHFGVAVAAHTQGHDRALVQKPDDLPGLIAVRQIVSGAVIEQVAQQKEAVRAFLFQPLQHLFRR